MSVSQNLNKFSFTNPTVRQGSAGFEGRPRSSTISSCRPRSSTKRYHAHVHDTPLMVHTLHRQKAHSTPCLPRHKTQSHAFIAQSLKAQTQNLKPKPRCRSRSPATRQATKHATMQSTSGGDHAFHAPEEKHAKAPELHAHATSVLAPLKVEKLAKVWAAKAKTRLITGIPAAPRHRAPGGGGGGGMSHGAIGHASINRTEVVHSFKEPPEKPACNDHLLQNTVGGAALTSNTPTALSSHMDPRLLQAASGITGTGLMTQMSGAVSQDSDQPLSDLDTPTDLNKPIIDAAALAQHPEQIREVEEDGAAGLQDERIPSDLMRAKLIGENLYNQQPGYDPLQDQYHMSAPLLDGGMDQMHQSPFPQYRQSHKSYYHSPEKYNFSKAIQSYDRSAQNEGMYCYSCIMFLGVLMIGVGIIMVIAELFGLFGEHKDLPIAIAGGGVLALGVLVLASAMLAWRRRRTYIKKKAAHV